MKLAIISHTEHYQDLNGTIVGWGPTISELNHLAPHFETIYHIAFLHPATPPPSSLPYTANNIIFVPLKPSGGASIKDKIAIVTQMPACLKIIADTLKKVDVFQVRTPTGIGVYLIPYLTLFSKKKGWYKYAGNWKQENAPLGYALQRWFLKKQNRKVTINGAWPDQPEHCYTFENPCLTAAEREEGTTVIESKQYLAPHSFCFVGRLEDAKGVQRILSAIEGLEDPSFIKEVHFIGDGPKLPDYKKQAKRSTVPIYFHGFLKREAVFDIYKKSSFLLLPSTASEGFPKVIAEGMNFGCIPIVSNVSSIGHYINKDNGYIVSPTISEKLKQVFKEIKETSPVALKLKAKNGYDTAATFTFAHYNKRIIHDILELEKPYHRKK